MSYYNTPSIIQSKQEVHTNWSWKWPPTIFTKHINITWWNATWTNLSGSTEGLFQGFIKPDIIMPFPITGCPQSLCDVRTIGNEREASVSHVVPLINILHGFVSQTQNTARQKKQVKGNTAKFLSTKVNKWINEHVIRFWRGMPRLNFNRTCVLISPLR